MEAKKHHQYKHGQRNSDEYGIWRHMKTRCENKNSPAYKWYGARGIKVCEKWLDFKNFFEDMGVRPSKKYSIDRINVDGNYEPSNCRWATMRDQQRNRRNNAVYTYNGITASLAELCELNGCKYKTVHMRMSKGAPIDQAMTSDRISYGSLPITVQRVVHRLTTGGR
jgi:hypothetical protein